MTTGAPSEPLSTVLEGDDRTPALVNPTDGVTVTRGELAGHVLTLAGRLSTAGVRRGDRVAIVLPNGPEIVEVLLAVTALGAAAAPLNPAYTSDELTFYLDDIRPRLMVLQPDQVTAAGTANAAGISVAEVSGVDLVLDGEMVSRASSFEDGDPDDVALVLHTSGTTSRPKQVPLRQRNMMASVRTIIGHYQLGAGDVSYCAMPLFHVHGLIASTLAALGGGGTVVVPRRFTPHRFWPQARDHGVTWVSASPTIHQMILDRADQSGPPATLRFVRSCSSALSPALFDRAEATYGAPVLEAYGMTEASHQMASNPLPPARRLVGSVGVPTGIEIGVIDRSRRFLPEGSAGEVVIRGPGVTSGYVGNPEANEEAFFDGWFRTGDRGVFDDGYLRLEGRLKEMILRGGENISPAEIEDALRSHPAVVDAVCFGVEDEKYGEKVAAAVTLAEDTGAPELIAHCRQRLAPFKVPERIHVLDRIPRTATGKVQRRRVAVFIAEEGGGR